MFKKGLPYHIEEGIYVLKAISVLKERCDVSYGRAVRIARTEGHRVENEGKIEAMNQAVRKGADVVKQWDSTLDMKTRDTHARLDRQIRELDEAFEIDGKEAMCPGGFGIASEDVNCRCVMLQRANNCIK